MSKLCFKILRNENGATAIEYSLLAAVVCVAIIGGLNIFADALDVAFKDLAQHIDGNVPSYEE